MPQNHRQPSTRPRSVPPRPDQPRATRPRSGAPVLWALAAAVMFVGLFLAGAAAQDFGREADSAAAGSDTGSDTGSGSGSAAGGKGRAAPKATKPPGLGDAVRDGKFEFVVSRADCTRTTVGPSYLTRTAQGRYCVIDLRVRNIADQPQLFLGSAQKAFDAAGTEYADDKVAGLYANADTKTFLQKIGPGGEVTGKLVFDVPKTTRLTVLELHDSFFSGGVQVRLTTS
jgi:hypothetical protein